MSEWWTALTGELQIFYLIGIIAGVFLVLQLVLLAMGIGLDLDMDFASEDTGVGFLSLRSLTAFFFAFGWTGVIMREADRSTTASVIVAAAVGLAVYLAVALFWKRFSKLNESGSVDYKNAVGETGSVYLTISANRSNPGKVEVMVQGRLRLIDAYTESDDPIPTKSRVKIVEVVDPSTVLVEPI